VRILAFDIVAERRGCAGFCCFLFLRFFAGIQTAGAEAAPVFDVKVFGERRNHGGAAFDLADAAEDNFGATVVHFDQTMNLDRASGEEPDVSYVFQIAGEDYDGEGARHLIFAEVQEVDSFIAYFHVQDFSSNALGFADVLGGIVDREAVGGCHGVREEHGYQRD
jgi:hypothetical protein